MTNTTKNVKKWKIRWRTRPLTGGPLASPPGTLSVWVSLGHCWGPSISPQKGWVGPPGGKNFDKRGGVEWGGGGHHTMFKETSPSFFFAHCEKKGVSRCNKLSYKKKLKKFSFIRCIFGGPNTSGLLCKGAPNKLFVFFPKKEMKK